MTMAWRVVVVVLLMAVVAAAAGLKVAEGQAVAAADCDAVVAEVEDVCTDFVVGKAPPSPAFNGPCCKTLRRDRASLSCLCGRVNFAALNQRNLLFTSTICLVPLLHCP